MTKNDLQLIPNDEYISNFYVRDKHTGEEYPILKFESRESYLGGGPAWIFNKKYCFLLDDFKNNGYIQITNKNVARFELVEGVFKYPEDYDYYSDDYCWEHNIDVFLVRDGMDYCISYCGIPVPREISRNKNRERQEEIYKKIMDEDFLFSEEEIEKTDGAGRCDIKMARLGFIVGYMDDDQSEYMVAWPKGFYVKD